jgi:hypothetical protein
VGRNQYSAEFGLGPLINRLTHPVFQYFQFASHGTVATVAMLAVAVTAMVKAEARAQNFNLKRPRYGNLN